MKNYNQDGAQGGGTQDAHASHANKGRALMQQSEHLQSEFSAFIKEGASLGKQTPEQVTAAEADLKTVADIYAKFVTNFTAANPEAK